jgi:hypothetical protein
MAEVASLECSGADDLGRWIPGSRRVARVLVPVGRGWCGGIRSRALFEPAGSRKFYTVQERAWRVTRDGFDS